MKGVVFQTVRPAAGQLGAKTAFGRDILGPVLYTPPLVAACHDLGVSTAPQLIVPPLPLFPAGLILFMCRGVVCCGYVLW